MTTEKNKDGSIVFPSSFDYYQESLLIIFTHVKLNFCECLPSFMSFKKYIIMLVQIFLDGNTDTL